MRTYTLISAAMGDRAPGVELAEAQGVISPDDLARLTELPEVQEFFAENHYGQDGYEHELMYLVAGEFESGRYDTLTVTVPEETMVPAALLLDHIPAEQVTWCVWEADDRPAPRTAGDLGDYVRDHGGYGDNGFSWPDGPRDLNNTGLTGLLAAVAEGRDAYLVLPGSYRDMEDWRGDGEDPARLSAWEALADDAPVMGVEHWDRDRYAHRWLVVPMTAILTADAYGQAVSIISSGPALD